MAADAHVCLFSAFRLHVSLKIIYSLRSEYRYLNENMSATKEHLSHLASLLTEIFQEFGDYGCDWIPRNADSSDFWLKSTDGQRFRFDVAVRERVTPQMADDLFERIAMPFNTDVIRLVYAPVISPRVAEIARKRGISYVDYAGNCHIRFQPGLMISRSGIPNEFARSQNRTVADLFSPKSSRIVRAMLHQPTHGWQVSELAQHTDVDVSAGLVSKVKQTLISQNYATIRDRLLYLKESRDLLKAWTERYPGAAGQYQYYMRGDTQEIEARLSEWCEQSNIEYALARFSAAWRLAPDVRYSVSSIYVVAEAFQAKRQDSLLTQCGAREVDSGANLVLLTPFDQSVFARRLESPQRTTSPLQTYLDLQSMAGRGAEAAEAVFAKHLRESLEAVDSVQGDG
jgi:hypothetical protein